jgi:tRNA-dihydrouridine synthase
MPWSKNINILLNKVRFPMMMDFTYMLAPIENMTGSAFRTLTHRYGADLTFTELIPIESLAERNEFALAKTRIFDNTPTAIQLIGTKEEKFEKFLASFAPDPGFSGFNLNLGCPNPQVIMAGQGSAMIKRVSKVNRIIEIIKKHSHPVSIKLRLGMNDFEKEKKVYLRLIKDTDADFYIVHARHAKQTYNDAADHSVFAECVATGKTIIANGDIKTKEQVEGLRSLGVKGVMIGRAAIRDPLIFSELKGLPNPGTNKIREELTILSQKHNSPERYLKNVLRRIGESEVIFPNG